MAEKNFFQILGEETPEIMSGFFDYAGKIQKQGGLDDKTFNLVYIALQASRGQVASVVGHTMMAKGLGATREEIRGAIITTMMTDGINGVNACLGAALDAYDAPAPAGPGGPPPAK
ncbi:MAG: carboxymuconolactone decarboxylase family protein [Oscillospiraceae bacterium]|jgi:alkylhydroperoxidase/carboxymuconolactone decarboxylase family protein YurZ|nr:carboxymuconolactone decarboxylase family protein [Oscillospiraceae bacterium]